jgi:hypothetical protein
MGKKSPAAVTVRRLYNEDRSSCEQAVRRLLEYGKLDYGKNRGRQTDTDGPHDAKGSRDEVRAKAIIPDRT